MEYIFRSEPLGTFVCDAVAEGVYQDSVGLGKGYLDDGIRSAVESELKRRGFEGREGDCCAIPLLGQSKIRHLIVVGLGNKRSMEPDRARSLAAKIFKCAQSVRSKDIYVHSSLLKGVKDPILSLQMLVEGIELASYHFHVYRKHTAAEELKKKSVTQITLPTSDAATRKRMERGITLGKVCAEATNLARDLVNTPSLNMHPREMAEQAKRLAERGSGITCKVMDRISMEKLGMHASLAVGAGSQHEPVFIQLIYRPKVRTSKKIAIVGKAITFDSGGLSLKPADHMTDMKIDMAGAAAVIGLFKALPQIKPRCEVHGLFIAAENMPSGSAYRPGDVVAAMDGTTIEVENTDAEGRVTLADALSFAALKIKPDAIVDLATLTGAVIVALGSDVAGLLSPDEDLKQALSKASKDAGEPMWELPLYKPYGELIKSKIADVRNVGGRAGGVITAALFLERFVHGVPWAHIDIAGPSYAEKEIRSEWPIGGTGWGVRTLINYLTRL